MVDPYREVVVVWTGDGETVDLPDLRAVGSVDEVHARVGDIARHRRAWWAVRLYPPAPILCSYMARRPPVFVRNPCGARHLNIAHGLYPREPLGEAALTALLAHLRATVTAAAGRTYAGGLTKFEPGELERVPVPWPGTACDGPSLSEEQTAGRAFLNL